VAEKAIAGGWRPTDGRGELIRLAASMGECLVVWAAAVVERPSQAPVGDWSAMIEERRAEGEGLSVDLIPPSETGPGEPAPPPSALWVGPVQHKRAAGRDESDLRPAAAIRHAATDWAVADGWGDHHFAGAMRRAFDRRGIGARVVPHHAWRHPFAARDLVITLRGLRPSSPVPGRVNVLWIISHPEDVMEAELDAHDLVAVASRIDTSRIAAMTDRPTVTLLQATELERFHRRPFADGDRLVFVGNSRGVVRRGVAWAVAEGLRPQIAGSGWEQILPEAPVADPVPNHELPEVLNRAGAVLADHWDDMRERGYVSNRVFDALAAGSLVLSDRVAGMEDVLPGVPRYSSQEQLGELTRRWLDPARRSERLELVASAQRVVAARHTFDRRLDELLAALTGKVDGGERLVCGLNR